MKEMGEELDKLVSDTTPKLEAIAEAESLATRGPGTWSRRQILGHLIDSAMNNLHRFIRAQQTDELVFPGYEQQLWVNQNGYQDRSWESLVPTLDTPEPPPGACDQPDPGGQGQRRMPDWGRQAAATWLHHRRLCKAHAPSHRSDSRSGWIQGEGPRAVVRLKAVPLLLERATMKFYLFVLCATAPMLTSFQRAQFDVTNLSWLSGCWEGNYANGRTVSEQWMKPLGNVMMGMSRTVKNRKTIAFENVRLEQTDDGSISYIANPSGQQEARFSLVEPANTKVVFENSTTRLPAENHLRTGLTRLAIGED